MPVPYTGMDVTPRFSKLKRRRVGDLTLPVASGLVRLLGLARLDREEAGPGLIIPRCHAIHTHGMRFPIHVAFLAADGGLKRLTLGLEPGQFLSTPGADLVVEIVPAGNTGLDGVRRMMNRACRAGKTGV